MTSSVIIKDSQGSVEGDEIETGGKKPKNGALHVLLCMVGRPSLRDNSTLCPSRIAVSVDMEISLVYAGDTTPTCDLARCYRPLVCTITKEVTVSSIAVSIYQVLKAGFSE